MYAVLQITWLPCTAATVWSLPLPSSHNPARVQRWMVACHCGHSGCIGAAWAPCPVPLVMCLSWPLVQTHLTHSYLCCLIIVMGTASFCKTNKPPCPWRRSRKRKSRCPRPNVPGPSQEHMAAMTLEIENAALFTWQPLLLWDKSAPPLLSVHFSALYYSLDGQFSEFLFNKSLLFSNALALFSGWSYCSSSFSTFSTKMLYVKVQPHTKVAHFSLFPLYRLNPSWSWFPNNPGFSTLPFQQGHAFVSNVMLRGPVHPPIQEPDILLSCSPSHSYLWFM